MVMLMNKDKTRSVSSNTVQHYEIKPLDPPGDFTLIGHLPWARTFEFGEFNTIQNARRFLRKIHATIQNWEK